MVKFPMDRPVKIVMLGAGGTGGYVAPYLFRLLHMLDILSWYQLSGKTRVLIITEADRSVTTIMLVEEY